VHREYGGWLAPARPVRRLLVTHDRIAVFDTPATACRLWQSAVNRRQKERE